MRAINWDGLRGPEKMDADGRPLSLRNRAHLGRYVATQRHAWPGGYLLLLLVADGGLLCPDCVRQEYRQIYAAAIAARPDQSWHPVAACCLADFDHPEDGEIGPTCDHCNRALFTL